MFHDNFSPLVPLPEHSDPWFNMVLTLKTYAEKNDYILAAAYGANLYDSHYYYVRQDFPDSNEIVDRIRTLEEEGYYYGGRSVNFALFKRKDP